MPTFYRAGVDLSESALYTSSMAKKPKTEARAQALAEKRRKRKEEPLDLRLSFVVKTGDEEEDVVTIMDEKEIKMVGSVFQYRDQAARFLAMSLVKVAATNKKVFRQVVPGLRGIVNPKRSR